MFVFLSVYMASNGLVDKESLHRAYRRNNSEEFRMENIELMVHGGVVGFRR